MLWLVVKLIVDRRIWRSSIVVKLMNRWMLCVVFAIGWILGRPGLAGLDPAPTVVSAPVAVFPLRNATGEAGLDWISVGLQDSLTVDLWYVAALHTKALPQMPELLRAVCPDPTLACVAGQTLATWQGQAKAQGYGGFLWGEYRRDGDALALRLGWYGLDGDAPLAEHTVRGSSPPELLAAATEGLRALLAARGVAVTEAEQARMKAPKTRVAAAWEQNALGYWEQIRYHLAAADAQRAARAAVWEQHLRAAVQADPDYAEAWNNLGWRQFILRNNSEAIHAFQKALRSKPEMIGAQVGMGGALAEQGKVADALPWFEQAVALSPALIPHIEALTTLYLQLNQFEKAEKLLQNTLKNQEPKINPNSLEIARIVNRLAGVLKRQNRYQEAEDLYRRALKILEKNRGALHLDTAAVLGNIAETLDEQGHYIEAENLYQKTLKIKEKILGKNHIETADTLNDLGLVMYSQGRYKDAESSVRHALSITEKTLNSNHPRIAGRLNNLAKILRSQGHYKDAEALYLRALNIKEQAKEIGPDHPSTATSLNNLAEVLELQGRYSEAETTHRRALAIREKVFGQEHPDVAEGFIYLAKSLTFQGHYKDAESLYRRALAIKERVLGAEHPAIATNLNGLAGVVQQQGRYPEAENLQRRALSITEKALGLEHPETAISLHNLAGVLDEQGRYKDAELLYRRALAIKEKAFSPDHSSTANSLADLAAILQQQSRYDEAETLHRRALAIREKALGPDHPDTASSLDLLAGIPRAQGRYKEAEALLNHALTIKEKTLGPTHPDTIKSLRNLAGVLEEQGRYAEAEKRHSVALEAIEKSLGPKHPETASCLNELALLFHKLGRLEDAKVLYDRARIILEETLGSDHSDTATSFNNLASVSDAQGRYTEAENWHRRALAIYEKALGSEHPSTANSLSNLAITLRSQSRYVEAENLHRRALAIREKTLGSGHPSTASSLNNLAAVLQDEGRIGEAESLVRRAMAILIESGQSGNPTGLMTISAGLGYLLIQQNRLTEAVTPYDTAVQTLDQLFANTRGLSEEARHTFVGQYAHIYREFIQLLLKLHTQQPQAGYDRKALEIVSRQQSRVFTELLRQAQVRVYDRDPVFQELKTQRDSLRAQVAVLTEQRATVSVTAPEADAKKANLNRALKEKGQALRAVDERLRRDYPRFIELEQPAPVTMEALQALLQPGEAVWTVVLLPEQTALFVVTRDRFRLQPVAVSRQTLTDLVARVRRPLEEAAKQSNLTPLADLDPADLHRLYQHLIAPVADLLKDARRVLVVADGPLYTLPFELLVTRFDEVENRVFRQARRAADGRDSNRAFFGEYAALDYLDTHYRFQYLPSLAALVVQRRSAAPAPASPTTTPRPALLAFADPIFGPEAPTAKVGTAQDAPATRGYSTSTQATIQLLTRSGSLKVKGDLPRLPDTAEETRKIASLLRVANPDRQLYLRERAQEQTVYDLSTQGQLQGLRYLLFSTHGLLGGQFLPPDAPDDADLHRAGPAPAVPPIEPREPALALTLVGDLRGQDGFLKMGEILGLQLDTDLVVLSACNTAGEVVPKDNRGEGFVGLTRAFLFAGAHHLLVSHWSVASAASRELMIGTFTRLQAGQPPVDALAEARQHLRQQTFQPPGSGIAVAYAHPLFWAPFVVVGD